MIKTGRNTASSCMPSINVNTPIINTALMKAVACTKGCASSFDIFVDNVDDVDDDKHLCFDAWMPMIKKNMLLMNDEP